MLDSELQEKEKETIRAMKLLKECCELNQINPSLFFAASFGMVVRELKSLGIPKDEVIEFLNGVIQQTEKKWEDL